MKKTIFYLATCSTCQKILKALEVDETWEHREIKSQGISAEEVDKMKEMAGSYAAIFSRRAMKYRSLGLNEMELTEKDYRKWIIEEYTFLKRPVVIIDDEIFVGNAKAAVQGAAHKLGLK